MTTKMYEMRLVLILALILCRGATAQSSCSNMLNTLSSCINFVTGNSSTPLPSCCSSLASVVKSQPECVCPLLSNGAGSSLGIAIDQTLAMALPLTCSVQTPQCNADDPAPSPLMNPPTDASEKSPTEETIPTSIPSGSKTVPETSGSTVTSIYLRINVTSFIAVMIVNMFHF